MVDSPSKLNPVPAGKILPTRTEKQLVLTFYPARKKVINKVFARKEEQKRNAPVGSQLTVSSASTVPGDSRTPGHSVQATPHAPVCGGLPIVRSAAENVRI